MSRTLLHSTLISVIIFLTGCQKQQVESTKPIPVAVFRITANRSEPNQRYTGQVRPRYEISSAFRVGGKVIKRCVELGQHVSSGTILAQLDPADYQLAVDAAKNELESAIAGEKRSIADERRTRDLVDRSMISQAEYDSALAAADSSSAATRRARRMLELAENRLSYCRLIAEYDCVVTGVTCEEGSVVQDGTPVFRLARTEELEAVVDLPENRLTSVGGLLGRVTLWSNSEIAFDAKLREIAPSADPVTRTYQARYSIVNPNAQVQIGMTATVELQSQNVDCGTSIPLTSLFEHDGKSSVWVVGSKNGSLTAVAVSVRKYGQDQAWIDSSIQPGELIVRAGVQKLDPSMLVSVWEDQIVKND